MKAARPRSPKCLEARVCYELACSYYPLRLLTTYFNPPQILYRSVALLNFDGILGLGLPMQRFEILLSSYRHPPLPSTLPSTIPSLPLRATTRIHLDNLSNKEIMNESTPELFFDAKRIISLRSQTRDRNAEGGQGSSQVWHYPQPNVWSMMTAIRN